MSKKIMIEEELLHKAIAIGISRSMQSNTPLTIYDHIVASIREALARRNQHAKR
jgi:hypothetical protein